jgi:hypothetical protein
MIYHPYEFQALEAILDIVVHELRHKLDGIRPDVQAVLSLLEGTVHAAGAMGCRRRMGRSGESRVATGNGVHWLGVATGNVVGNEARFTIAAYIGSTETQTPTFDRSVLRDLLFQSKRYGIVLRMHPRRSAVFVTNITRHPAA